MKIDWSFPRQILLSLLTVAALGAYPLLRYGDSEIMKAAMMGALLTTVNVLLGYAAIEFSYGRSMATFFKYVLGGMGIRMFVMAGILVVLIKVLEFHIAALIASMGILYVVFLTLEISYIQKKVQQKQQSA
ncbi:MAG TPA: hypothetical protein VGR15_07300 [Bacteroidota bacterium]|jgi:hypothetical protein|nr:hypothetical protein [Bacteroidota bacterium]